MALPPAVPRQAHVVAGEAAGQHRTPAVRLPAQPHHNTVGRHEQRAPCPSTTTAMIAASLPPARAPLLGTALPLRPVLVLVEPS